MIGVWLKWLSCVKSLLGGQSIWVFSQFNLFLYRSIYKCGQIPMNAKPIFPYMIFQSIFYILDYVSYDWNPLTVLLVLVLISNSLIDNIIVFQCIFRELFQPVSSVYWNPELGEMRTESLTSGDFDQSKPSNRSKEVRQFERNAPPRGTLSIRSLGGYKSHEGNFMKD